MNDYRYDLKDSQGFVDTSGSLGFAITSIANRTYKNGTAACWMD